MVATVSTGEPARTTSPSSARGVVGTAHRPRAVRATDCAVVLVEASDDVGDGTSKANTAILHTGFDATPGTLESRLVRRGYALLSGVRRSRRHPGGADRRAARRLGRRAGGGAARSCGQGAVTNGYDAPRD